MDKAKTKIGVIVILALIVVLVSAFVFAGKPDFVAKDMLPSDGHAGVTIPAGAVEVAPGVFQLPSAKDVDGRVVEGFMFVDNRKQNMNPNADCGDNVCQGGEKKSCPQDCTNGGGDPTPTSTCFSLFAKGARWRTTENYTTGSVTNTTGIDATLTETSLNTWDSEVIPFDFEIFGPRDVNGITDGADDKSPDGKNEVEFQNLGEDGPIAFAIVWGIFTGKPSNRELVEWDAVFNSHFAFGNFDNTTELMDYQNIATHEFGHALGLTHPGDTCTEETMYAFADFNETNKRDLEAGDIAGVNELYS